jgi:hypothetical protein
MAKMGRVYQINDRIFLFFIISEIYFLVHLVRINVKSSKGKTPISNSKI